LTSKPSVVDVPAHQKLVPQSQHDLVLAIIDVKVKLANLDLNTILKKVSVITEAGLASKIQTIREILDLLDQINIQ
jgi:hypothetical protein